MTYRDLRDFLGQLETRKQLRRSADSVSPKLEMTAIGDRLLRAGGPAVLFTQPSGFTTPVLINLFGTPERVALGMGAESVGELREVGRLLAALKEPEPPRALRDAGRLLSMARAVWDMKPARHSRKATFWSRATGRCSMSCAAGSPSGATTASPRRESADMARNEKVDVLIIGSGASGAAVAWSLAETKMRILCLEQGDWMKPTDFPSNGRDWEELARRGRFDRCGLGTERVSVTSRLAGRWHASRRSRDHW